MAMHQFDYTLSPPAEQEQRKKRFRVRKPEDQPTEAEKSQEESK